MRFQVLLSVVFRFEFVALLLACVVRLPCLPDATSFDATSFPFSTCSVAIRDMGAMEAGALPALAESKFRMERQVAREAVRLIEQVSYLVVSN